VSKKTQNTRPSGQEKEEEIEKRGGEEDGEERCSTSSSRPLAYAFRSALTEKQRTRPVKGPVGAQSGGATKITLTDPYIRLFYQQRNLMEFLETVVKHKAADAEVAVHLITIEDEF
jgi:ATP-dependent Lon protease